ncbi:MAG: NapC/NirT family cytochrome c [Candidatus Kapabacteria bacterium]|nr:NapC/NirT family cytochrome c [Candidatus Kapabacteria bacterium]
MSKYLFPRSFYNPSTIFGVILCILAIISMVFLLMINTFNPTGSPYLGIAILLVLPGFLALGLFFIILGIILQNMRTKGGKIERRLPVIDFNNLRHRRGVGIFIIGGFVFSLATAVGSYQAFEYTESDEFCGTVCHKVMSPEYTAYKASAHSKVGCVKCHIGGGANWYVKSKFSGSYQVYSVLMNLYSRPIETPIHNLRPAPETCEQCHWPRHFYHEKKRTFEYFLSDEKNTKSSLTMLIKVGGGNPLTGNQSGIHYKMNIENEVSYYTEERDKSIIPYVVSKNVSTGKVTVYKSIENKVDEKKISAQTLNRMDCIDCHNRPAHSYGQPNFLVNNYLSLGKIDTNLPFVKSIAVDAMETYYENIDSAMAGIQTIMKRFYSEFYPDVAKTKYQAINNAVADVQNIFQHNYFPQMNVSWKRYPVNLGHIYSNGCFRCHDDRHVSDDGKVISRDCNLCHVMISQTTPVEGTRENASGLKWIHPGNDMGEYVGRKDCSSCHGVKKKSESVAKD